MQGRLGAVPKGLSISQRQLANRLRRLRAGTNLTQQELARQLGWSDAKLSRIENALGPISNRDLAALLEKLDVSPETRSELLGMNRSRKKGWYDALDKYLPSDLIDYIEVESQAARMHCYQQSVVHGLLQTEAYARHVIESAMMGRVSPTEIRQRLEARMRRQQILVREKDPLQLWIVLNEAALLCPVGGREVMREQIRRLIEIADLPNVSLQVLPLEKGVHPAIGAGSFDILYFPGQNEPAAVYEETMAANRYEEDEDRIFSYTLIFDHIRATALGTVESRAYLVKAAEESPVSKEN